MLGELQPGCPLLSKLHGACTGVQSPPGHQEQIMSRRHIYNVSHLKLLALGTASVSQMTRLVSLLSSEMATVTGPV